MSKSKDISILHQLKKDARGSYAILYKEYFGMVEYLVVRNNGSREDASDVFQDTVIVLFEMIHKTSFKLTSSLSTLLYSIARNIWYKQLKSRKKEGRLDDFEKYIPFEEEAFDWDEKEAKIIEIEKNIQAMGDPCKTILIHFYYLKKKMKEIADHLRYKSADQAKTQKYKCLQRLKQLVRR